MLDVEEADQAGEKELATEKTEEQTADLECVLPRVVIASVADAIADISHAINDPNKSAIDRKIKHGEDSGARVER